MKDAGAVRCRVYVRRGVNAGAVRGRVYVRRDVDDGGVRGRVYARMKAVLLLYGVQRPEGRSCTVVGES